jgi:hypothetical protein
MAPRLLGGRRRALAGTAVAAAVVAAAAGLVPGVGNASSHREAPLISEDPKADNTDVYAFVSPDKPDSVTLIANWIPFEEPNGGPNFYPFAEKTAYDINIDNDGDARPDLTYRWWFHNSYRNKNTFLYNTGVVTSLNDPDLNFRQTYTLQAITPYGTRTLVDGAPVAPSNTGKASMPNYAALSNAAVIPVSGGKAFAGQADDPFFLDLRVFDLLYGANLSEVGQDTLTGYNVNTVALQVPKSVLALKGDATRNPVIGIWSTTSRPKYRILGSNGKQANVGELTQVSRLGMPLVNEVVVPLSNKTGSTPPSRATTRSSCRSSSDPRCRADPGAVRGARARHAAQRPGRGLPHRRLQVVRPGAGRPQLAAAQQGRGPRELPPVRDAAAEHGDRSDRESQAARRDRR